MARTTARAVWTGSLSFGLVNIPVKLYNATVPKDVRFHQLEPGTGRRIRYRRVAEGPAPGPAAEEAGWLPDRARPEPEGDLLAAEPRGRPSEAPPDGRDGSPEPESPLEPAAREISYEEIVKGYEIDRDRYVMVRPDELRALEPEQSRTIEIEGFVDLREIDPIYFEKSYYAAPQRRVGAEKPYALLMGALQKTQKVGIARFVLRSREYLAAIRPMEQIIALQTMYFSDEVRPVADVDNVPIAVRASERELTVAGQLIDLLSADWDPSRYRDTYRERVLELIEARAREEHVVVAEPPPAARREVADLMAALRASVDAAKEAAPGRRKGRRRKTG